MTTPNAGKPRIYFVNPWADGLAIGGASLLAFALFYALGLADNDPRAATATWVLVGLLNWPHFAATFYRLYHSSENTARYPMTAWLLPVVIAAVCGGCFLWPAALAPVFVKVFLLWSPYHYSGQTVGISRIYGRRSGCELGPVGRSALSGLVFGTFAYSMALADTGTGSEPFYAVLTPQLGLPAWVPTLIGAATGLCAAVLAAEVARWSLKNRRFFAPIVLFAPVTQCAWFLLGPRSAAFYQLVPAFHGLQYLLIAWVMQLKEKQDELGIPATRGYVFLESARWAGGNLALGFVLFWALPRLAAWAGGWPLDLTTPILISAVQLHHFFVDGVIWKLRSPQVGSRLLVGVGEMAGAPS